ncbi:MAG: tetratricopeptide repeat protein [Candidatus Omnitrophica bacterium]|nr:tetratricopeptide repeat protein [Candidatus Omnitrophota bacterium]
MKKYVFLIASSFFLLANAFSQETPADDYEKLKRDYEQVVKDRDNILAQIKNLLKYKAEIRKMEDEVNRVRQKNEKAEKERLTLENQVKDLKEHIDVLQKEKGSLVDEIEALEKHIENREIEYKIVDEFKKDLTEANSDNQRLKNQNLTLQEKIKKINSEKIAQEAEAAIYRRQVENLRQQYSEALKTNKRLEKELENIPKRFAEIARENKVLIKETALMHYNLGVFYIEKGQYKRAIAELEKAIELNPEDSYAYFNLGYIYAEHLVNRKKAIEQFRQYLKLANKQDKEVDWVKRYILTWQSWEGNEPIK